VEFLSVSNLEQTQSLSCAIMGLISNHSKAHAARFRFAEAGRFFISTVLVSQSRQDHRIMNGALGRNCIK
jgi:hypothetical protein